jgi:glutamate-1-semialdehyde 2,1-aminomutase
MRLMWLGGRKKVKKGNLIMQNAQLYKEAQKYLVAGVNSPVRTFNYVGCEPILAKKGEGSRIYDYDGNNYIDYVLGYGVSMLGHAHREVIAKTKTALNSGFSFGLTNKSEIELAKVISEAIPFIEKIRFVNSGTEAVMGAVRLARGSFKRNKIIKFKNSYHGHADYLLAQAGSGLARLKKSTSSGVPDDFIKHTIVLDYNDKEALTRVFDIYGYDIAAVIVEPVGGNYGVIEPDIGFLQDLRLITKKYKALLIFDEVITGFRFLFGSFAQSIGVEPDIICLGKIIGGGLPIGAFAGKAFLMDKLAPLGDVYQASTFAGGPIVMQAGLATLELLKNGQDAYKRISRFSAIIAESIRKSAAANSLEVSISQYGSLFSLRFSEREDFCAFYKILLSKGIFFAPSEFEANFISFAHSKADIDATAGAVKYALENIYQGSNNG